LRNWSTTFAKSLLSVGCRVEVPRHTTTVPGRWLSANSTDRSQFDMEKRIAKPFFVQVE
jgi:hypothetical protein